MEEQEEIARVCRNGSETEMIRENIGGKIKKLRVRIRY